MSKLRVSVTPDGEAVAIYHDWLHNKLPRFFDEDASRSIQRASHVETIVPPKWSEWFTWRVLFRRYRTILKRRSDFVKRYGSNYFGIFWAGRFAAVEPVFLDAAGRPFSEYQPAVAEEIRLLQKML